MRRPSQETKRLRVEVRDPGLLGEPGIGDVLATLFWMGHLVDDFPLVPLHVGRQTLEEVQAHQKPEGMMVTLEEPTA